MRFIVIILLVFVVGFSCVKPKTKNPIPAIEFQDVYYLKKSEFTNKDTAVLKISYEDGDGNLFVDNTSDGSNIIFTPYIFDALTNKFVGQIHPITRDTLRISNTIKQPDNGYYKGKSIKGDIYMPMSEYRLNDNIKMIMFTGFVIDMKNNKSNVVSSPVYTLNY